jgi:hypothetical protein
MTTYAMPRPRSALARELAATDRIVLTTAWFPEPESCHRCGCPLPKGPDPVYSLTDYFFDEPGQFWQERRVLVCEKCAGDEEYAAERLGRKRGVRRGKLATWGNTVGGR